MQTHIQVGVVVPQLDWLPTAVDEWKNWADRRLAGTACAPLHPIFKPPADLIGILTVPWSTLHTAAAHIAHEAFIGPPA
jgi:hypothetical protein